ncbi:carbon monoxide dehydrogenase [Actinomadura sp. LD22]|uniref:Carbon monoxide dehydrogenase n=1 Tax=Actinomadura physcomitrii TaxID=2650748 RepID=A0A6I4ME65_9ACTN|nr:SRPBCC family protein [Actinomadura physcomitrii]MWA02514.1 carbon monoxide dehydrogenase [Actinomadura physcomitrii]
MRLENAFTIPVPADEAWRVLLDIERIAPCVPGAALTSRDGDRYHGKVKVRLGPIGLTYSGSVAFVSLDEDAGVAVLEAAGRETRGGGTAKAVVTCRLTGRGDATDVHVETDLAITGKPAQFGRGALADVSAALLGTFAANLAEEIAPGGDAPPVPDASTGTGDAPPASAAPAEPAAPEAPAAPARQAAPVDLLRTAGPGAVRLAAAPAAASLALLVVLLAVRRRRRAGRP